MCLYGCVEEDVECVAKAVCKKSDDFDACMIAKFGGFDCDPNDPNCCPSNEPNCQ